MDRWVLFIQSTLYLSWMKLTEAQEMISPGVATDLVSNWSDLGCGKGLFTNALASLLLQGSQVHAVDKEYQQIKSIEPSVPITFEQADIESVELTVGLDGILMANAIHYVRDKASLLTKLSKSLNHNGRFIIVEYDDKKSNPWVPYPISFRELEYLSKSLGFVETTKLNQRPSRYGGLMYSCMIKPFSQ